ncbi:2-polyprenyl-6-methoxyphenol hydroxylase [Mycena polygramma]|nr:2-polyprenyl-6-methoxyphenol hydroxylase [Mycena polygramma]
MAAFLAFYNFRQLRVAIVDGGLVGLATAVALRRSGHLVEIYDSDCCENEGSITATQCSTRWLRTWGVDIPEELVSRESEWHPCRDQKDVEYLPTIRQTLFELATSTDGKGRPCGVFTDHSVEDIDVVAGTVVFKNQLTITADLIICGDKPQFKSVPPAAVRTGNHNDRSRLCMLSDPMVLQGASEAFEDAAALGLIFSDKCDFTRNVPLGSALYDTIRERKKTLNRPHIGMHDLVSQEVSRMRDGSQLSLLSNRLRNDRMMFAMRI